MSIAAAIFVIAWILFFISDLKNRQDDKEQTEETRYFNAPFWLSDGEESYADPESIRVGRQWKKIGQWALIQVPFGFAGAIWGAISFGHIAWWIFVLLLSVFGPAILISAGKRKIRLGMLGTPETSDPAVTSTLRRLAEIDKSRRPKKEEVETLLLEVCELFWASGEDVQRAIRLFFRGRHKLCFFCHSIAWNAPDSMHPGIAGEAAEKVIRRTLFCLDLADFERLFQQAGTTRRFQESCVEAGAAHGETLFSLASVHLPGLALFLSPMGFPCWSKPFVRVANLPETSDPETKEVLEELNRRGLRINRKRRLVLRLLTLHLEGGEDVRRAIERFASDANLPLENAAGVMAAKLRAGMDPAQAERAIEMGLTAITLAELDSEDIAFWLRFYAVRCRVAGPELERIYSETLRRAFPAYFDASSAP